MKVIELINILRSIPDPEQIDVTLLSHKHDNVNCCYDVENVVLTCPLHGDMYKNVLVLIPE